MLTQSLVGEKSLDGKAIASFYIRRCFRILPMMWAAILFTFALFQINHAAPPGLATGFYNFMFDHHFHITDLLRNIQYPDFFSSLLPPP